MDGSDMSAAPSSTVTENKGQKRARLKRELTQLLELHARACARQRTLLAAEPTSSHDSRNNIGSDAAVSAVHGDSRGVQEPAGEGRGCRAGSMSRQSSGGGAGARGNEVEHESVGQAGADVFTKERRVVGARMTVAGNDFDGSKESSHDQADMQVIKRKKGAAQPRESIAGEGDLAYEGPEVGWDHSGERSSDGKRKFPAGIPRSGPSPKRFKPLEDIDPAVWQQCIDIVSELSQDSAAWGFMQPVSVLWPGLVDYYQLIKDPMDLGTVMSRLESREYVHPRECARDVRLTFSNAMKYNNKTSDFFLAAKRLKARFDSRFRAVERRVANPPVRTPAPAPPPLPPPPVPAFRLEGLANSRQATDRGAVKGRTGSELGLVQAQGDEDRDHRKSSHKPRRKVPPSNLDEEGERKPARPLKPKKAVAGSVVRDPESGVLVDPRLGRSKSAKAYGGPRPLTQKEMCRLANTVQDLPEDRQNIIYAMVSKKVQAQPDQQQGIAEFDMSSLDTGTMFEIFRITMNWQKSKSKILRTPKVPKEEGAGKIKASRPQPQPAAAEADEEDVDIMNDSPGREDAVRAEAVQPENAAEAEVTAAAPDDESDSDSSDSSGSGSSSDGSSSGSSSGSDSDSDSDGEKGSD